MIFPMTILICHLTIKSIIGTINAISCHIIFIVKIELKWSNNANNTCVCDYIAWKVQISIITLL